jgi:hypothetical protein
VHGSQGSAIITVCTAEGRTVRTVRIQFVQQEGSTISKEEVRTDRTVLAGMISEADFVHLLLLIVICKFGWHVWAVEACWHEILERNQIVEIS